MMHIHPYGQNTHKIKTNTSLKKIREKVYLANVFKLPSVTERKSRQELESDRHTHSYEQREKGAYSSAHFLHSCSVQNPNLGNGDTHDGLGVFSSISTIKASRLKGPLSDSLTWPWISLGSLRAVGPRTSIPWQMVKVPFILSAFELSRWAAHHIAAAFSQGGREHHPWRKLQPSYTLTLQTADQFYCVLVSTGSVHVQE